MRAMHCRIYLVGARVVLGCEQGTYDCEPLGRDGNSSLTTPRDELAESLNRVALTPPSIHQPELLHEPPLANNDERDRQQRQERRDDG